MHSRAPVSRAPGNPGHYPFPNSREWNCLVPGENGNRAADGIAVIQRYSHLFARYQFNAWLMSHCWTLSQLGEGWGIPGITFAHSRFPGMKNRPGNVFPMYNACSLNNVSSIMGRDNSWSATVFSAVSSYSHTDSSLIGSAQFSFPMSWFFLTTPQPPWPHLITDDGLE